MRLTKYLAIFFGGALVWSALIGGIANITYVDPTLNVILSMVFGVIFSQYLFFKWYS